MQVSVETTSGLERRMTVQVPAERIEQEIDSRLRDLARRVRLDGFRPGKVPLKVVKRRYDGQVRNEVVSEVMQRTFQEAVIQEKLHPAGGPKIEPKQMEPGQALEYSATFEVYPEVELASMAEVTIERPVAEVADEDVDQVIERLRKQRTVWNAVERAAVDGDQVVVSFKGRIDGEAFSGGQAENVPVVLGSGDMIPGFEEQLVGAKSGEQRSIAVTFPEDYGSQEVAGKSAVFEVEVASVSEAQLPEVDEEFARSFGVADGSVEAMRKEVRANMERELKDKIRAELKKQVMDALLERNDIAVPTALVEDEIDRAMQQSLQQQPESMRNMQLPRSIFADSARRRVTLGLLLGEILRVNDIKLDAERVRATLEELASTYDQPDQVIAAYRNDRSLMTELEGHVLEEQVVDFMLEQAKVVEKPTTFAALTDASASSGQG